MATAVVIAMLSNKLNSLMKDSIELQHSIAKTGVL